MAAFAEGRHAQAFPVFGSERMGAPIVAFCRIADMPIRTREPIDEPDAVIVQDPTLLHVVDLFNGLTDDGCVLVNSARTVEQLGLSDLTTLHPRVRILTVPATDLAREHTDRPTANAVLLGAFAAMTGIVSLDAIATALGERFSNSVAAANHAGAVAAHAFIKQELRMAGVTAGA
jgi:pyruvate ferredoxin oxidoreductase gamma subunit